MVPARSARVGEVALLGFLALVALLHLVDRRDPRFAFVSAYALLHPLLMGTAFAGLAVAASGVAVALWTRPAPGRLRARAAALLLVSFAVGVAALALYRTDHVGVGVPSTPHGHVHDDVSRTIFLALPIALLLGWSAVARRGVLIPLALLLALVVAAIVPAVLQPTWVGLHQRVFVGALLLALLALARRLRDPRFTPSARPPDRR